MVLLGVIREGDSTSSGGKVVSASGIQTIRGRRVALVGDICTCPIPGHGNPRIVEGSSSDIDNGRQIAYHGCALECGCFAVSSIIDEFLIEPNRGGMDSSKGKPSSFPPLAPVMDVRILPSDPDSFLPRSNQTCLVVLSPVAERSEGVPGDVLVMIWVWKNLGLAGPSHSVGHVAAAIRNRSGEWKVVQSRFPHGPNGESRTTGPNTTIAGLTDLRATEGGRLPDTAFRLTLPNLGAYAKAAMKDLRRPIWNWDPRWRSNLTEKPDSETNCTFGVIEALKAGGARLMAWPPRKRSHRFSAGCQKTSAIILKLNAPST